MKNRTKKDIQSEQTIRNILEKSIILFGTRGYHSTTMSALAQAAGLTKGGLYCHFKSKEELFTQVVNEVEKRFLDPLIEHIDGVEGKAIDKLLGILKFNSEYVLKHKEIVIFLLTLSSEVVGVHPEFERILKGLYEKYIGFVSNLIEQGKNEGTIRKDLDSNLMSLFYIGAHDGILLQWSLNHDTLRGREIVKTAIKLISKGFSG